MEAEKERYWCYSCEQHFEANQRLKGCSHCQSEAVELAPNNNDPASFEIYQVEQPVSHPPQTNPSQQHSHNVMPNINMNVFPEGMSQILQIGPGVMPQFQQSPMM